MVIADSAHAAFHKAAHYFGVRVHKVPVAPDFRADVEAMAAHVNERTALVAGSAPQYPQGVIDPIPELAALAADVGASMHVDACMGGFVLPFMELNGERVAPWDFRVPGVTTISADVHKLGYAPKGASVLLHRSKALRRHQTFVFDDWLGGFYASPGIQGSRPGLPMATAWAVMHRLGIEGYRRLTAVTIDATRGSSRACARFPDSACSANPTHICSRCRAPRSTCSRSATRCTGGTGISIGRRHPTAFTRQSARATLRSSTSSSPTCAPRGRGRRHAHGRPRHRVRDAGMIRAVHPGDGVRVSAIDDVHDWEKRGERLAVSGRSVWVLDAPARDDRGLDPLLVLHGFPSCSFDWRHVLDALCEQRRVIAVDFLGFGLSDKPDLRYGMRLQADVVEAVAWHLGLPSVALLTHDMGDTVGGELLARSLEGTLPFAVTRRVLTNGSIYIDMAQLTAGQHLLLSLDDAPTDLVVAEGFKAGLAGTFSPKSTVDDDELEAQWLLAERNSGNRLLPRTIRYIEDRRAEERRFTGAIETHPSPLAVVWGADDPIAVVAMTDELRRARPDTPVTVLDGVGHYPMIETPDRFAAAVTAAL